MPINITIKYKTIKSIFKVKRAIYRKLNGIKKLTDHQNRNSGKPENYRFTVITATEISVAVQSWSDSKIFRI